MPNDHSNAWYDWNFRVDEFKDIELDSEVFKFLVDGKWLNIVFYIRPAETPTLKTYKKAVANIRTMSHPFS